VDYQGGCEKDAQDRNNAEGKWRGKFQLMLCSPGKMAIKMKCVGGLN